MTVVSLLLDPDDRVLSDAQSHSDLMARARLVRAVGWASIQTERALPDPLADLLLERVLDHEGPFATAAERLGPEGVGAMMMRAAAEDLRVVQRVVTTASFSDEAPSPAISPRAELKRAIFTRADWSDAAVELALYFHRFGCGVLGRHRVFRWHDGLVPAVSPDPVSIDDLIGYEDERQLLAGNLDAFVAGRSANNALLYGDRGSGKSSTVKALAGLFPMERLRLVEVSRDGLWDFPQMVGHLRHRAGRFLLFVDDLSFDESDEGHGTFAGLKSLLEGGVESQPSNVLLYATSNRRHLVKEMAADRQAPTLGRGEVHVSDTFQEKISLSDRFGLRVLFLAPDQDLYLRICRHLAGRRGIEIEEAEALLWCRRHNARSCRTARQFVDHVSGRASRS